ncbi:MAG: hypothetical protein NT007_06755 [Candidatus Kapabacteria bacterium]|nr:hypothetical protein [Candidatus Kapabacteria bacterium]
MQEILQNPEPLNFDKVWLALMETRNLLDSQFQETRKILDSKFQESDRKFQETRQLLDLKFQETDRQMKETDRQMKETDRQMKETDRQMKETDRQMKNLMSKTEGIEKRWGKFVESLVDGALVRLFREIGIQVNGSTQRSYRYFENKKYEYDLTAKNGDDLVVVEVKTTMDVHDVKHFINKLKKYKTVFSEYKDNNIFGAVAFINCHGEADVFAEKHGLYLIKATGESAKLANIVGFKPRNW